MFVEVKWVVSRLKEWKCVLVGHHENIGKVIEELERQGWRLHTSDSGHGRSNQLHCKSLSAVREGSVGTVETHANNLS